MMTYLNNVLLSWSGFMTPIVILAVIVGLGFYIFAASTRRSNDPQLQETRKTVLEYRSILIRVFVGLALATLLLAMVMPGNTPKNNIRMDPTMQERQQQLDKLRATGSGERRIIVPPGPGSDPERELRQACREARQGYREMDMTLCEGIQ